MAGVRETVMAQHCFMILGGAAPWPLAEQIMAKSLQPDISDLPRHKKIDTKFARQYSLKKGDGMPPGVFAPNRPDGLMMPTDYPAAGR
jgi:hypothetical protein